MFNKGESVEIIKIVKPDNYDDLLNQGLSGIELSKHLIRKVIDIGIIVKQQKGSKNKSFSTRYIVRENSSGLEVEYDSASLRKV